MPGGSGEKWAVVLTENGAKVMPTHAFTLILRGIHEVTQEAANALFEAGCEDGTFCAREGVAHMHFDREAATLEEAIRTALDNVRAAGFDVERVESDEFATICHFNRELAEAWSRRARFRVRLPHLLVVGHTTGMQPHPECPPMGAFPLKPRTG